MIPYLVHQAFKAYSENVEKKKKKNYSDAQNLLFIRPKSKVKFWFMY